jgi:purine-nucleoside phosphorylase
MSIAHDTPALTVESTRTYRRHVEEAATALREAAPSVPPLALVLDAGLDGFGDAFEAQWTSPTGALPHFPETEEDADRTLAVGTLDGTPVAVLDGALPLHDGFTPRQVAFPVRMLAEAGVGTLLFANAAGSVHPEMEPADLFLLTDHINFQGANPLVGPNVEEWGPRFPDMSEPYDPDLRRTAERVALQEGMQLQKGIYFAVLGPNLGTPAEYRMARTLGGDVVGTSMVPEVIAARHMDRRVMAVSVIADRCAPDAVSTVTTADLTEAVADARPRLRRLLRGVVGRIEHAEVPA